MVEDADKTHLSDGKEQQGIVIQQHSDWVHYFNYLLGVGVLNEDSE